MSAAHNAARTRHALEVMSRIVDNSAPTEAKEAVAYLKAARERLEQSRIHALQQLGELNRVIDTVSPMAFGTNNLALVQGLEMLIKARRQLEHYVSSVFYRKENLGRTITQIDKHVYDTVSEARMSLRIAAVDLEDYASQIE
jgi:hypothetical protein